MEKNDKVFFEAEEFNSYLISIIHQWSKTLATLGFTLVPLFIVLDYFTMPEDMLTRFAWYRIITTLAVLIQFFLIKFTKPSKCSICHGYFVSIIISLMIILMTVDLGGFNSRYYAGLNLVIIGVNLLIPWKARHSAINGLFTICLYIAFNIIITQDFSLKIFLSNLFFMSATVIIAVSINYVKYKLIKKEFQLRSEVKSARDALWGEMEIAKKIQTALLPFKTSLPGYEIAATMLPADEVGGDYYDILETAHEQSWISIGDVSGHGVESGLIMMMTQTSISSLVNNYKGNRPSTILYKVNHIIKENISRLKVNRYMTISLVLLRDNEMTISGKHQDVMIFRTDSKKIQIIPTVGTWLGVADDIKDHLTDNIVPIDKDDIILFFTDGVTEAADESGEMFGEKRLENALKKYAEQPVKKIVKNIVEEVINFQDKQEDDITLMIIKKIGER
jgi:serine phosphatase RsbU (regulator of sigma subunit)